MSGQMFIVAVVAVLMVAAVVIVIIRQKIGKAGTPTPPTPSPTPSPPSTAASLWEFPPYYHAGIDQAMMQRKLPGVPSEDYSRVGISYSSSNYVLLTAASMCAWATMATLSTPTVLWSLLGQEKQPKGSSVPSFSQSWCLKVANPDIMEQLYFPQTETITYAQKNWNFVDTLFDGYLKPYSPLLSLNQGLGDGNIVASPAALTNFLSQLRTLKGLPDGFVDNYILMEDNNLYYDQSLFSSEAGISFSTNFIQSAWFYQSDVQGPYSAGLWNFTNERFSAADFEQQAGPVAQGWTLWPPPMGHNGATWGGSSAVRIVRGPGAALTAIALVINADVGAGNGLAYVLSIQAAVVLTNLAMSNAPSAALSAFGDALPSLLLQVQQSQQQASLPEGLILSVSVQAAGSTAAASEYRLWEKATPQQAKSSFVWGSGGTKIITALNAFAMLVKLYPSRSQRKEDLMQLAMTTGIMDILHDKVTEYPLKNAIPVSKDDHNPQPKGNGNPVGIATLLRQLYTPVTLRRNLDVISIGMLAFMQSGIQDFQVHIPGTTPQSLTADTAWQFAPGFINYPFGPVAWLTMPTLIPPT